MENLAFTTKIQNSKIKSVKNEEMIELFNKKIIFVSTDLEMPNSLEHFLSFLE